MSTKRKRKDKQRYLSAHQGAEVTEVVEVNGPKPNAADSPKTRVKPVKPAPTITQRKTINVLNASIGTSYAAPTTEQDARFLIDGMVVEERRRKRSSRR